MLNKKIFVKNITNLSEARYCAGMFVDYISFDLNPESEYYIERDSLQEIKGWLSGVKVLGSYEGGNEEEINKAIVDLQLDGFLFSQNQFTLSPLVDTQIKLIEWLESDLDMLPTDIEKDIILVVISNNNLDELMPNSIENTILHGYNFENVEYNSKLIAGFGFLGNLEKQVGINSSEQLMNAFEYVEENY